MRLLALLLLVACSRTTEFIGSPPVWNCGPRCFFDENLKGLPAPLEGHWAAPPDPLADDKPQLRYPLPGSLHPINLADVTFQWRSARAMSSYYRIRLAAGDAGYDFYVPCRAPPNDFAPPDRDACQYQLPARAWARMAGERAGAELSVTIAAWNPESNVVATSEAAPLSFSPAPLEAGLYYFSLESTGIWRAPIGGARQPFVSPTARFGCVGCHAVSRDGGTEAHVYERKYLGVSRVEAPAAPLIAPADPPVADAATVALSPDGSLVAVSHDGQLLVRESATGRTVDGPLAGLYFPDWSPDGRSIVATQATQAEMPYAVNDGAIVVVPWDGTKLGMARTLVADGQLNFHPAWSPDGAWIAFASAPLPGSSYDNRQARLRLVASAGGTPVELVQAGPGSWPRFAPVAHAGGNVLYLGFDSRRDYGYLLRNSGDPMGGHPQLWLAALDLRKLPGDPSSAPLWLPFQRVQVANLLPAWAERLACGPQSPCGDRARCESGGCVPLPP